MSFARMMLTPRLIQTLVIAVAFLLAFTLLDRAFFSKEDVYTTYANVFHDKSPNSSKNYVTTQGNIFTSNVANKVSPWLGGSSVSKQVQRAETIYSHVLQQRRDLLSDYNKQTGAGEKSFPTVYNITPYSIWDFVPASFNCPHSIQRLGRMGDGGKWLCGLEQIESLPKSRKSNAVGTAVSSSHTSIQKTGLKPGHQPGCIIYSLGIQTESTFEEELIKNTPNCQIWGYDFSVDEFGPALKDYQSLNRAWFTKAGIAGVTKALQNPPFYTIQDLMKMNGHDHIDVLKMDIEGFEFETMKSLIKHFLDKGEEIPIAQYQVEIHLFPDKLSFDDFLSWWELLERAGFRPVWTEPNLLVTTMPIIDAMPRFAEYTFLNIKDKKSPFL